MWQSIKSAPFTHRTGFCMSMFQDFLSANGFDLWQRVPSQRDWAKLILTGRSHPILFTRNEAPPSNPPASDHSCCFKNSKTGVTCYTSQPYDDPADIEANVKTWARRAGLAADVCGSECSWYFPDSTCLIVIHAPDVEILRKPRAGQ